MDALEKLQSLVKNFREQADFVVVYIMEAHPIDVRHLSEDEMKYKIATHSNEAERIEAAKSLFNEDLGCPILVDTMMDSANLQYAAFPDRLYVIHEDNKIAYAGGQGPFDFKVNEVEAWLEKYTKDK